MTFLNSIVFNDTNTAAGLPLTDRFSHLSVPLGLVCVKHGMYDKKRNVVIRELICERTFDNLANSVQHVPPTLSKRPIVRNKKTKKNN